MEKKMMNRKWISFFPIRVLAGLSFFLLIASLAAAENLSRSQTNESISIVSAQPLTLDDYSDSSDSSTSMLDDDPQHTFTTVARKSPASAPPSSAAKSPEPLSDLIAESLPENPSDLVPPAAESTEPLPINPPLPEIQPVPNQSEQNPPAQNQAGQSQSAQMSAESNPVSAAENTGLPSYGAAVLPSETVVPAPARPQEASPDQNLTSAQNSAPAQNPASPAAAQAPVQVPDQSVPQPSASQQPYPEGMVPPNGPQPGGPRPGGPAPMVVVVPQENKAPAAETPAVPLDPETAYLAARLRTPRLVFEFLLNLLNQYNQYEEASKTLDFSDMPDVSDKRKKELAYDLYMVLFRLSNPDPATVPNDGTLQTYAYQPNKDFEPLYLVNKGGMFLFSPETVSKLSNMYKQMQDLRPKVADEYWPFYLMSDWWFKSVFGLRRVQWAMIGVILIWGYFLGWLVSKVLYYLTLTTFHIMSSDLSEYRISKQTWRPIGWLLMYSTWFWGIVGIQAPPKVIEIVGFPINVLAVLMTIVSGTRLINILAIWGRKKVGGTKSKLDEILIPLLTRSLKILLIVVGIGLILQSLGFSAVGIVSGMGIGGIAIALAAQNTIANLFGSLTVMMDRPFVIGDWIVTGEIEGTVEAVGLRSTRIRTFYNSLVTVPNNVLTTAVIDNMGRRHFRRYKTTLGVQYDTPPDRIEAFCEGIRELILSYNFTRKDVFHVYANEFNASSIDILLICFLLVPDTAAEHKARGIFILDILRLAEKMDIRFAFPTQTIYNISSEDKGYEDPLLPSDEFGKASAAGIIEKRIAKERARRSAAAHAELEEEITDIQKTNDSAQKAEPSSQPNEPDELKSVFPVKAEGLRKRSFFRRAS